MIFTKKNPKKECLKYGANSLAKECYKWAFVLYG